VKTSQNVFIRRGAVVTAVAFTALAVLIAPAAASGAPSTGIDFLADGYTAGYHSPAGQNGWWQAKDVDFALVENDSFPAAGLPSGGRSLQFSNATQESGGAHLISPAVDPAGESTTNALGNTFETTFTIASATGALQPGLGVDVALDGASRYGGVLNFRHTDAGLTIGSYWVPADATSADLAAWRSAVFATVSPDAPHTVRAVAIFLDGQPDLLQVFVDGALVSGASATTWEFYATLAGTGGDRSVDSLSFKTSPSAPSPDGIGYVAGLPPAPATQGLGFLFSDISYGTTTSAPPVPTETPVLPTAPEAPSPGSSIALDDTEVTDGEVTFEASGFLPYENVYVTLFSTPVFAGWFQANASGTVTGTVTLPAGLAPGAHTIQLTGVSGFVAVAAFTFVALAATGVDALPSVLVGSALVLAGGALVVVALLRRSAQRRGGTHSPEA
jgi:hypothetical protein